MTNFKSGSGNLDFGEDDTESTDEEADSDSPVPSAATSTEDAGNGSREGAASSTAEEPAGVAETSAATAASTESADAESAAAKSAVTYPYFVRRNNVGDERDTRLEIHVRDKVAEGEAEFRHTLAAELGVSDVSKTDAREFALLAAFRHPERVAELMADEGFDSLR